MTNLSKYVIIYSHQNEVKMSNNTTTSEETNLRLTAFHMAREILNEQARLIAGTGGTASAPTTEQIQTEAEKILTFIKN